MDGRLPGVVVVAADSQYSTGNSRFVEHEYSYIAELQPPVSSCDGVADTEMELERCVSGRGSSGEQLLPCHKPAAAVPTAAPIQLLDHNLKRPASSSAVAGTLQAGVVSLSAADSSSVRGVVAAPSCPAYVHTAQQGVCFPAVFTGNSSFPAVHNYCDSLGSSANV